MEKTPMFSVSTIKTALNRLPFHGLPILPRVEQGTDFFLRRCRSQGASNVVVMKGSCNMLSIRTDGYSRRSQEYASAKDFCSVFRQDTDVLYWLALVLTADAGRAEQCFVAGLEECMEGNAVFKEWARSWSRRVVIKNAIRLISPQPGKTNSPAEIRAPGQVGPQTAALAVLANLQPFERFVFVMSVLEGYADRDCATLLGCSVTEVAAARLRAFQQIPRAIESSPALPGATYEFREQEVLNEADVA